MVSSYKILVSAKISQPEIGKVLSSSLLCKEDVGLLLLLLLLLFFFIIILIIIIIFITSLHYLIQNSACFKRRFPG